MLAADAVPEFVHSLPDVPYVKAADMYTFLDSILLCNRKDMERI
jgi:hypothetical protein